MKTDEMQIIREEERMSIETHEEFKKFCSENEVFYWYGEEYRIRAIIKTEQEFINFMQKVGMMKLFGMNVPFFVNQRDAFNEFFYYKDSCARSENDMVSTFQFDDDDPVIDDVTIFPTITKEVFTVSYNPYFEKPYRIRKTEVHVYSEQDDIGVKPEITAKFPAVVSFSSMDTFDRCGTVTGQMLTIDSLNELTSTPVFA